MPAADVALWKRDATGAQGWHAKASAGSRAELCAEAGALRLDFTLAGHGAWAIARREVAFRLPRHYVASLQLHGEAAPVELQLKLVDPSGANVWWWRRRGFTPSPAAERIVLRRVALEFAWGPRSGGDPDEVAAVELAVASDQRARGCYWVEDLRIEPRPPAEREPRAQSARASSFAPGHEPARVLEPDPASAWQPAPDDARPWLELDLGERREIGGVCLDLEGAERAPACRLLGSEDGAVWTLLGEEPAAAGARQWLRTGEAEARWLRLEWPQAKGLAVARVAPVPIERAASPARYAAALARAVPRGRHPRHLLGEHADWAVVGGDGDERKGLLGADGALEVDAEGFTLEPFLGVDGRVLGWADVEAQQSLADGCLPIPSVRWEVAGLALDVTAFTSGGSGASALVGRYAVSNAGGAPRDVRLLIAIRPFQVTPAWQALNLSPAVAPITRIERAGARVRVNGAREVIAVSAPDHFGAARSDEGLRGVFEGVLPAAERVEDPLGFAEGVLAYDLHLAPGASESVVVAAPLFAAAPPAPAGLARAEAAAWGEARLAAATRAWRDRLAPLPLELPPAAADFDASLRASLAWILVNREGPRIQPGPRCYRRSWIRDGVLSGAALAEFGFAGELRAFLRWYAPYQLPDGRVPCGVDRSGIDRAVEHDSHGQLVWGIVELWRLSGDLAFLRELWPHALRAVDAIARLRAERSTEAYRGDPRFGLLPESISHEGYAANPAHAYWDDFFALRALADAADAALALGDREAHARIAPLRDAMRRDLHASIAASMAAHGIDHLPGAAELGDFDPTSSAIALDPCGEGGRLPARALERTFERYWREFEARRRGEQRQDAYSPYEIRNAVALLRLGWKERALGLLEWLIAEQRPPGWRQWPELSTRDPRTPRFLGDLPHGWVASSLLRAIRRLLVDERDDEGVLVIAAGIPEAWVRSGAGVRARGLPTHFGALDVWLRAEGEGLVRASLGGPCRPPGGFVLTSPLARPLREARVDGRRVPVTDARQLVVRALPAEVELVHARRAP
jgi:hypothetical protein